MVPLLFSPFYSQFFFPPQQDLKDFRNLKELKRRMNFSRIRKQNRGLQGFCEEGKKSEFGGYQKQMHISQRALLRRNVLLHGSLVACFQLTRMPLAKAERSHARPPIECLPAPYALRLFPSVCPPSQGWESLPCELSHRSAMQPSLQLCCHRHDSGHPALVTPHTSQTHGFLT